MRDSDTPRSFRDQLGEQIVNIYVGSKPEKFCVHRRLLCRKSQYFERVLNGSREVFAGVLRYEMDADIDAFTQLIEWLYKGTIASPPQQTTWPGADAYINGLIDLYILAEKLEIKGLADDAVENIGSRYSCNGSLPSKEEIDVVFRVTRHTSTLRRYMTAAYRFTLFACCHSTVSEVSAPTTDELWKLAKDHEELGKDVFRGLRKGEPEPEDPRIALICDYHNHDNQVPCNTKGKRFNGIMEMSYGVEDASDYTTPASLAPPALRVKSPEGHHAYKTLSNLPIHIDSSRGSHNNQRESSGSSQTIVARHGSAASTTAPQDWQTRIDELMGLQESSPLSSHGSENPRADSDRGGRETNNVNSLGTYPVSNKRSRPSGSRHEEDIPTGKRNRGGGRSTR